MVTMFIDTLPSPFYDKEVGSVASNFADLVIIGERIEIIQANNSIDFVRELGQEWRKGETNSIIMDPSNPYAQGRNLGTPSQHGRRIGCPTNPSEEGLYPYTFDIHNPLSSL
ncbi:hypothetical protein CR513_12760, partial [Mucuna pruriens]